MSFKMITPNLFVYLSSTSSCQLEDLFVFFVVSMVHVIVSVLNF